jgi:hypothetical protein
MRRPALLPQKDSCNLYFSKPLKSVYGGSNWAFSGGWLS